MCAAEESPRSERERKTVSESTATLHTYVHRVACNVFDTSQINVYLKQFRFSFAVDAVRHSHSFFPLPDVGVRLFPRWR